MKAEEKKEMCIDFACWVATCVGCSFEVYEPEEQEHFYKQYLESKKIQKANNTASRKH